MCNLHCVHAANEFHIFVVTHYFMINFNNEDPWLCLSSDENRVDLTLAFNKFGQIGADQFEIMEFMSEECSRVLLSILWWLEGLLSSAYLKFRIYRKGQNFVF